MLKKSKNLGYAGLLSLVVTFVSPACDSCGIPSANAGEVSQSTAVSKADIVRDVLVERLHKMGFSADYEVSKLPEFKGMYQIEGSDGAVFITDENARYFIVGWVYDPIKRVNITQNRLAAKKVKSLRKAAKDGKLFYSGKADAKYEVAVFTDPDCPYCAKMESIFNSEPDIKVYHVLTPLTQLHPQARDHATLALCSKDPNKALSQIMEMHSRNIAVPMDKLDNACRERSKDVWKVHDALRNEYHVNGTPLMVRLSDGQGMQMALPRDLFVRWAKGEDIQKELQAQAGR